MASPEDLARLRRMAHEPEGGTYTDEALSAIVDSEGTLRAAAYAIWVEKAARYSALVDTSESGSSRRNSQLHANALNMMQAYSAPSEEVIQASSAPFTVGIERA